MQVGDSLPIGKEAIKQWVFQHFPQYSTILDVGAGGGTYAKLLAANNYRIDAVEAWEPTIPHIINIYRTIYCVDIRYFPFQQNYDLVIMGDVLEHLTVQDAQTVLKNILQHCKYVLIAVPFMFEQEPIGGNPLERHLQPDLNFSTMQTRYPQLELLLYTKSDQYMHYSDDTPCWVEYAYYIAKGELHE